MLPILAAAIRSIRRNPAARADALELLADAMNRHAAKLESKGAAKRADRWSGWASSARRRVEQLRER